MRAKRPDSILKALARGSSFLYAATWMAGVVVLVGLPVVRGLAAESSSWEWGLPVSVRLVDQMAEGPTLRGGARLEIKDVEGSVRLPIPRLSWGLVGVLWSYALLGFALMLWFLQQLRRILQRARDGAPFDPDNARRLERLGQLALTMVVVEGVAGMATSAAVRADLAGSGFVVPVDLQFDGWGVLVAFVLLALARVFQRGADLEHEQSLVV